GQEHLKRVMTVHADGAAAVVAEQGFHFRDPLRMRRTAQAETVREQAGPVFARPGVAALEEALAPEVLGPFLTVPVVRIAPQPGRQRLLLIGRGRRSNNPLVEFGLSRGQAFKAGARQLAWIPGMIGPDLRVADVRTHRRTSNYP